MSSAGLLLAAALFFPLVLAICCLSARFRARALAVVVIAPLPALAAAVLVPEGRFAFFPAPFRLTLVLDQPGAILLGGAALLWSAAGAYAASLMARDPAAPRFAIWWLLTLTGSLGLFIVGDVVNFYLLFTLASLAAYGLIIHEQSASAHRAGVIYVGLALLGEAFLLIALVMLSAMHPDANPQIRSVVAELPASPMRDGTLALFIFGFALKMGLVPLHVWLPLAHPAAPTPASAVLSGVVVKAGVIGLIRFLPFEAGAPLWGSVLIGVGLVTAYYGVIVGITQPRAKTVLAYSTVSQMGLVAVLLGVGLDTADPAVTNLTAYYAVHHTLVKGALFLGVGILATTGGRRFRLALLLTAVLALSLGGMPLTSGALAKLATKPLFGYGWLAGAMTLAAFPADPAPRHGGQYGGIAGARAALALAGRGGCRLPHPVVALSGSFRRSGFRPAPAAGALEGDLADAARRGRDAVRPSIAATARCDSGRRHHRPRTSRTTGCPPLFGSDRGYRRPFSPLARCRVRPDRSCHPAWRRFDVAGLKGRQEAST